MFKYSKKNKSRENILYNKIISLSRNKLFYTKLGLTDTFQNRSILIFLHISFLLIRIKRENQSIFYKKFNQRVFDITFQKIELNMREIGYGDTLVNRNMKFLIKIFYNILLNCENYNKRNLNSKNLFLSKYLTLNYDIKNTDNAELVAYFDKFYSFCFELSLDSVLKGELNFNYK